MQIAFFDHSLSSKLNEITHLSLKTTERESNRHQLTSYQRRKWILNFFLIKNESYQPRLEM